jgi:myo-inositol-1(or 4)-monophosphatase
VTVEPADEIRALDVAMSLAAWARDYLGARRPVTVTTKTDSADLVTDLDVAVETHVRRVLGERFPGHRVEGEELGSSAGDPGAPSWWVDPLDGTANFVHGLPWTAFSLALVDARGPVVAVIADLNRRALLSARRGHGACEDGTTLRCSESHGLAGELVLTELAGSTPWPGLSRFLSAVGQRQGTLRVMGASALSLAAAARGDAVACVLPAQPPYDTFAGALIAHEAGMHLFDGEHGIVAAAPGVAREIRRICAWARTV